jgi:hypothetical protein
MKNKRFELDVSKFAKQTEINLETVVKRVSFDVYNKAKQNTPVDTGRARGSWNISEEYADLSSLPQGQYPSGTSNAVGNISGKEEVHVSNNVEYIDVLDQGSSRQAPQGIVDITVAQVEAELAVIIGKLD